MYAGRTAARARSTAPGPRAAHGAGTRHALRRYATPTRRSPPGCSRSSVHRRLVFRHPLVRSAVVQLATPNQRRAAHMAARGGASRRISSVGRRIWQRQRSIPTRTSPTVLEAAAESATRRGGAVAAVTWLTRAAELSENHPDRSRRPETRRSSPDTPAQLGQAQRLVLSGPRTRFDAVAGVGAGRRLPGALPGRGRPLHPPAGLGRDREAAGRRAGRRADRRRSPASTAEPEEVLTRLVILLLAISQYSGDCVAWEEHARTPRLHGRSRHRTLAPLQRHLERCDPARSRLGRFGATGRREPAGAGALGRHAVERRRVPPRPPEPVPPDLQRVAWTASWRPGPWPPAWSCCTRSCSTRWRSANGPRPRTPVSAAWTWRPSTATICSPPRAARTWPNSRHCAGRWGGHGICRPRWTPGPARADWGS